MVRWRLELASVGLLAATSCEEHDDDDGPAKADTEPGLNMTDEQPGPPELVSVSFTSQSMLRLYFSEPVVPTSAARPEHFRLSFAGQYTFAETGLATIYYDAGSWAGGTIQCGEVCEYYYDDYYYEYYSYCYEACFDTGGDFRPVVVAQMHVAEPNVLELTLDPAMDPGSCESARLLAANGYISDMSLFVHHAGGQIHDLAGEPLASIAEHWVGSSQRTVTLDGDFAEMDPFLPIPCPEPD